MSSLPLIALPSCRLASSSAHDRYICQEVESLDIQSKAQPVCAAEPMMAGFVCGLLRLPDTIRASTDLTAFLRSRSLVKVAKQEPTRLSLSGGANMYVAVHLFIRFYFFFDGYSGAGRARANGRIFLGGPL